MGGAWGWNHSWGIGQQQPIREQIWASVVFLTNESIIYDSSYGSYSRSVCWLISVLLTWVCKSMKCNKEVRTAQSDHSLVLVGGPSELDLQSISSHVLQWICWTTTHLKPQKKKKNRSRLSCDRPLQSSLSLSLCVWVLCRVMVPCADCRVQTARCCWVVLLTRLFWLPAARSDSFRVDERTERTSVNSHSDE